MARVVVVGGGMSGLATALFGARRGHDVTVVDRDPGPPEGSSDAAASWERRGVAQAHFAHGWPARSSRILRQEAPELLTVLQDAGIGTTDARFGPGFEDDRVLTARRPVYEAVLRRFVAAEPGVDIVHGSVAGLVAAPGGERIIGARLADGSVIDGDVTVDAGGRRSASTRWLRALGFDDPITEDVPCGLHYLSRHYRFRDGENPPVNDWVIDLQPYMLALAFLGDNRTFSLAMALSANDPLRARLQDADVYDRVLGELPAMADWVERAEPVSDVYVMAGLSNRHRRLVEDGRVIAPGLVLVGDSALYTNPTLGQGVSLGFWMAQTVAGLLERTATDPVGAAVAYEAWIDDELGARFRRQVDADRRSRRQLEAGTRGSGFLPPDDDEGRHLQALVRFADSDAQIGLLLSQVSNLLVHPSNLHAPHLRFAVEPLLAEHPGEPPPADLSRADFQHLVAD